MSWRREAMLARKRREYRDYLPQFYDVAPSERTEEEANALRQVGLGVQINEILRKLCVAPSECAEDKHPLRQASRCFSYIRF